MSVLKLIPSPQDYRTEETEAEVCLTPSCVKAAARMLDNMNEEVNPCDNFYRDAQKDEPQRQN